MNVRGFIIAALLVMSSLSVYADRVTPPWSEKYEVICYFDMEKRSFLFARNESDEDGFRRVGKVSFKKHILNIANQSLIILIGMDAPNAEYRVLKVEDAKVTFFLDSEKKIFNLSNFIEKCNLKK